MSKPLPSWTGLLPAVLLSIDSATVSGVVIHVPEIQNRKVVSYETPVFGFARTQKERQDFVEQAQSFAEDLKLPLVIVGEEWTPHGIPTSAFISLCENWGRWLAEFEQAEIPSSRVLRVNPNTWRSAILGKQRPKKREDLKLAACRYVEQVLKRPPEHHDIAEARLIGVWGQRSKEAHLSIGKAA